jgi:hypothetical protein
MGLHGNQRNLDRQRDAHLGRNRLLPVYFQYRREILRAIWSPADSEPNTHTNCDTYTSTNYDADSHSHVHAVPIDHAGMHAAAVASGGDYAD